MSDNYLLATVLNCRTGVCLALLLLSGGRGIVTASADQNDGLTERSSSLFDYRYEGDNPRMVHGRFLNLGAGYYGSIDPHLGGTIESDGSFATISTPQTGGLLLKNPLWESDADHDGGWTWEMRFALKASDSERNFQLRIGDAPAGAHHPHLGLQFCHGEIKGFNGTRLAKVDLLGNFVTLRIAQEAGRDDFLLWLNSKPLPVDVSAEMLTDGEATWIGDGSSASGGDTIVDYIRWTGKGAYAPPPTGRRETKNLIAETSPQQFTANHQAYVSQRRDVPDFGLMLNDDGDASFPSSDPQTAVRYRQIMIDALAGTPVRTLMCSVGMGSDTLYYPTTVASRVGWRETRYSKFYDRPSGEEQMWAQRLKNITNGMHYGVDPIRVAGERAQEHKMYFVPSYRMNDDHFMFDPLEYPMTGKFWMDNHERFKIRDSPVHSDPRYGQLLDYSHKEVRDFRLAVLEEVIDRYRGLMDGLELDFNRVQVFFPRNRAKARAHLITDLVSKVRQRLDEVGKQNGRTYYLFVRVPPTLANCEWAGLDIVAWVERQLVDVLIPAQLMTLAHDMPTDTFVKLAEPHGVKVYPAIYPRTEWMWPMLERPVATSYNAEPDRTATPELYRGAAANYWQMGASGFQLYNFQTPNVPFTDAMYRTIRDLADLRCLRLSNKIYAVTPGYYLDYEDTYQYQKQLPATLQIGESCTLELFVGENLTNTPTPDDLQLRLGFRDVSAADHMVLWLGDNLLHEGPIGNRLLKTGTASRQTAPSHYMQLTVDDVRLVRQGKNKLAIRLRRGDSTNNDVSPRIVECQLGVFYCPRPNAIFEP